MKKTLLILTVISATIALNACSKESKNDQTKTEVKVPAPSPSKESNVKTNMDKDNKTPKRAIY